MKTIIWDREAHLIIIKGSIYQEEIVILNVYALHNKSFKTHEAKINSTARKNRQIYNYSQKFQRS